MDQTPLRLMKNTMTRGAFSSGEPRMNSLCSMETSLQEKHSVLNASNKVTKSGSRPTCLLLSQQKTLQSPMLQILYRARSTKPQARRHCKWTVSHRTKGYGQKEAVILRRSSSDRVYFSYLHTSPVAMCGMSSTSPD